MVKVKNIVKSVVFILVFIIIFTYLSLALTHTYRGDSTSVTEFYKLPKNSVDVIYCGSSSIWRGIIPNIIWQQTGMTGYNRSSSAQMSFTTYYRLMETFKYQTPRVVVLDAAVLMYSNADIDSEYFEPFFHTAIDAMRFSDVKVKMALDVQRISSKQNAVDVLFPFFRFHSRWSDDELSLSDFKLVKYLPYMEFTLGSTVSEKIVEIDYDSEMMNYSNETIPINAYSEEYFNKSIELCKENGAEVIVFRMPTTKWSYAQYQSTKVFCDKNSIEYIDLNFPEAIEKIGLDFSNDFLDDQHTNVYGAEKISRYVGEIIAEKFTIQDKRASSGYSYYDEKLTEYDEWKNKILHTKHMT